MLSDMRPQIVLFSVPGAFTGVCEKAHVPSYSKNVEAFKAKGVDMVSSDAFLCDARRLTSVMRLQGDLRCGQRPVCHERLGQVDG